MDSGTDEALRQLLDEFAKGRIGADVLPRPADADPASGRNFLNLGLWIASLKLKIPGVDLLHLLTDGANDQGVDIFAIEANGAVIVSPDDAVSVADSEESDIRLIFLQAHRRKSLTQQDVAHFVLCVQLILEDYTQVPTGANAHYARQFAIYCALRRRFDELERPFEPNIELVYCFGGQWAPQFREMHEKIRLTGENNCRKVLPGCRVDFAIWDAAEMVSAARAFLQPMQRRLADVRLLPMPGGERQGFIGLAGARGLIDGLVDHNGTELDARLFDENPRHFHGLSEHHNPGAYGLNQLLRNGEQDQVAICNNGVTIVAEAAELMGPNELRLLSPQVVNGCQTCYVLFENRDRLGGAFVPLKVVVTQDVARIDAVVRGANTQRNMAPTDLLSRVPFTRRLADYLKPGGGHGQRIYFARRSQEPLRGRWPGPIDDALVFNPRHLLETYVAAVLERPHSVQKGIRPLIKEVPISILNEDHEPEVYACLLHVLGQCRRWAAKSQLEWQDSQDEKPSGAYGARHMLVFAIWRLLLEDTSIDVRRSDATREKFRRLTARIVGPEGQAIVSQAAKLVDAAYHPGPVSLSEQCSRQRFTAEVRERTDALRAAAAGAFRSGRGGGSEAGPIDRVRSRRSSWTP